MNDYVNNFEVLEIKPRTCCLPEWDPLVDDHVFDVHNGIEDLCMLITIEHEHTLKSYRLYPCLVQLVFAQVLFWSNPHWALNVRA